MAVPGGPVACFSYLAATSLWQVRRFPMAGHGAVAVSGRTRLEVPAFRADVRHTHCAGAAFSAGLLYGLLHDWPMRDSLDLASASGALRCERAHHESMPGLDELGAFMRSRQRIPAPAA